MAARIKEISVSNFKRFKQLQVSGLEETNRFVFLLGPNGCGKSSLFEAFNCWCSAVKRVPGFDSSFYLNTETDNISFNGVEGHKSWEKILNEVIIEFHGRGKLNWHAPESWMQTAFILRGSQRILPDHHSQNISRPEDLESLKHSAYVLRHGDTLVEHNYQRLVNHQLLSMANPGQRDDQVVGKESLRLLRELASSVHRVFPELVLDGLGDPQGNGTFIFRRNGGSQFRFSVLSSGEKSVFDLLLDVIVKKEFIKDTIYCIDEPELHTHSALQLRMMNELGRIVPQSWQLWVATHSIGLIRWAMEEMDAKPNSVAFLDLGSHDMDSQVQIQPVTPTKSFWSQQFAVAIGELADLVVPDEIILCEGDKNKTLGFDAEVLQQIYGDTHPRSTFVSAGSCSEVKSTGAALALLTEKLVPATVVKRLFDRDDRTPKEVVQLQENGDAVLSLREIENYLFDNEIIQALVVMHEKDDLWEAIEEEIKAEMATLPLSPRCKPKDDVKSAAPKIHQILKKVLQIERAGSDYKSFAITHLVPLFKSSTVMYQQLENEIWPGT